jgi:hypothetical protein
MRVRPLPRPRCLSECSCGTDTPAVAFDLLDLGGAGAPVRVCHDQSPVNNANTKSEQVTTVQRARSLPYGLSARATRFLRDIFERFRAP